MSFETDRIDDCIRFMQTLKAKQQTLNGSRPGELCVMATGGGAFKFYDKIRQALGVDVLREDEMECLIIGTLLNFQSSVVCLQLLYEKSKDERRQLNATMTNRPHRPRLLHNRNPPRSIYLLGSRPNGIR